MRVTWSKVSKQTVNYEREKRPSEALPPGKAKKFSSIDTAEYEARPREKKERISISKKGFWKREERGREGDLPRGDV